MARVSTVYPEWLAVLCLVAGVVFAVMLYGRLSKGVFPSYLKWMMATTRFLVVTLMSFLLLSPVISTFRRSVEKPLVVIAQDCSRSILQGGDSVSFTDGYPQAVTQLIEALEAGFEVRLLKFAEGVTPFQTDELYRTKEFYVGNSTDIAGLFDEVNRRYSGKNLAGVIMSSDGLYNKGINPVYSAEQVGVPVHAVTLGDTLSRKDLRIYRVHHNQLAFLGNYYPVEITVKATVCKNERFLAKITRGGDVLFEEAFHITTGHYTKTISARLEADKAGMQVLQIQLTVLDGEINKSNNTQVVFVDVHDERQLVQIIAEAPHPDIDALYRTLNDIRLYEARVSYIADYQPGTIKGAHLLVLHQVPSEKHPARALLQDLERQGTPTLIIVGAQTNMTLLNNEKKGLQLVKRNQSMNEALPTGNKQFPLFSLSSSTWERLEEMPPLSSPFGRYTIQNNTVQLLSQRIGSVVTTDPLICFNQINGRKYGWILGEGIWKWRLVEYRQHASHQAFQELIGKTTQYLSVKEDKSFFRVNCRGQFYANELVELEAELYNETYELVNDAPVSMTIRNEQQERFSFKFIPSGNSYTLSAGQFPVGYYTFNAQASRNGQVHEKEGAFHIVDINLEGLESKADHDLLQQMCDLTGGRRFSLNEMDGIAELLEQQPTNKSVSYMRVALQELIDLKWLFFLFISLLSFEWAMRKWHGHV